MDKQQFEALVGRLENSAAAAPQRYTLAVLGVAALGFGILALAFSFALASAALLVGLVVLLVAKGGGLALLFVKLGKLVVLLAIPAWTMVKSSLTLLFSRFPAPEGRVLTAQEAPRLFKHLAQLRRSFKGPAIHQVLLTDELNAAIVQHPRFGLFGWERNTLVLGLPLLQTLGEEEALSVVAHEYGHLSGHHSRLGGFIYRFRAAWGRLQDLSSQWTDWGSRLIAKLFQWYAPYFNAYTFVLARQNEYLADRTAAEVAGVPAAASALMRVSIAGRFASDRFWPAIDRRALSEPEPLGSRSAFWEQSLRIDLDAGRRSQYLAAAREQQTDHMDTHPALVDRLAAMGAEASDAAAQRLEPPAVTAAAAWLGPQAKPIAAEFDEKWRQGVTEKWRERHEYLRGRRERLEELEAKGELNAEEQWDRIRALDELRPEQDLLPPLNALLTADPRHLPARFRRGTWLLEHEDEAGIADLEAVMAADADSLLAGCEAAWRFYQARAPQEAEAYAERWRDRSRQLATVQAELSSLPPDAQLAPADLDAEAQVAIAKTVREHGKHVSAAYLLQRILKSDSSVHDYVLAVETSRFTLGDKGPAVVKRLAAQAYPVHLFIVHLGSEPYKAFRKSIKRLGVQPLGLG